MYLLESLFFFFNYKMGGMIEILQGVGGGVVCVFISAVGFLSRPELSVGLFHADLVALF